MKRFYSIFATMFLFFANCACININSSSHQNENKTENTTSIVPEDYEDHGIFSEFYEKAFKKLKTMTLEEKIGQLFLARCPSEGALDTIHKYKIGGFVLFGQDFQNKTSEEVISTLTSYQKASSIPLILSTDEEGGSVVRVSSNENLSLHRFLSPQDVFNEGGMEKIKEDATKKSKLLKSLGINVNLAPVADVSIDPNDFIFDRSFGKNANETADFVKNVVTLTQENGISCALKHFPGYGNNVDTHTGISIDERPYENFVNSDFIPFKEGIKAGVHFILVSHNIVKSMDDTVPASLSSNVHKILRDDLGFTGLIITDDLAMDAIKLYTSGENPATKAVLSLNDMMIITDIEEGYSNVLSSFKNRKIPEETINKACFRVLAYKYFKGLI